MISKQFIIPETDPRARLLSAWLKECPGPFPTIAPGVVAALREALDDPTSPKIVRLPITPSVDARFANSRFLNDRFAGCIIPAVEM